MTLTTVFKKNIYAYNSNVRYIINKGATRSGKSWSILQLLYLIAKNSEEPLMISVVSESMPHLKRGCIRDFNTMLMGVGEYDESRINKTDNIYSIGNSKIEFFSADTAGKVHGPARDILFINECQNISYSIFTQLDVRTRKKIFLDFNPVTKFWVDKNIMDVMNSNQWILIHSTYRDNPFLTAAQVQAIESRKNDTDWWNVYGLGITGGRDGLVYDKYKTIRLEDWPTEFSREWLGLDFGFTQDPTAIIHVGIVNGELYLRELCYEQGLTNQDIAKKIKATQYSSLQIIADSAEKKSIEELRREGLTVIPAVKGAGSITSGVSMVKRYPINVLAISPNLIDELDQYRWQKNSDGNLTNMPIDKFNHALDAVRYVIVTTSAQQSTTYGRMGTTRHYN